MPEVQEPTPIPGKQGQFGLQRIYVKDLSFEAPNAPQLFKNEWKPKLDVELDNRHQEVEDGLMEVVLSMTVKVENQGTDNSNQVAYIVEIAQAGLFVVKDWDGMAKEHLLRAYCPNILFPYAREAISDVISRGSFPQMLLAPINFDAMFADAMKKKAEQESTANAVKH